MLPVLHFVLLRAFCVKMELKYRGQTHGGEEKGQDLNMWHAGEDSTKGQESLGEFILEESFVEQM